MGTTTKALKLLDYFTPSQPELGLSEMSRLSGTDKATTFRLLSELCEVGFVEQSGRTKLFRLGPAVLRFANVREHTFPARKAASRLLAKLVDAIGETAHVTELQGRMLSPVVSRATSHHATRVHIDPSEMLPLHATASGRAVMAFADAALMEAVLERPLAGLTAATETDADAVRRMVEQARETGFGFADNEFEDGVCSVAAPLFGNEDACVGAVAVVFPAARKSGACSEEVRGHLGRAAIAISEAWGGKTPDRLRQLWSAHAPA